MSWGINVTGTKEATCKKVSEQLDKIAASYEGKEEAKDVLVAKERILSLVGACALGNDGYTDWNAVCVNASGSHSTLGNAGQIMNANFQVQVTRMSLAL